MSDRSLLMPQVWLTYEELGTMFGIRPEDARAEVILHEWSRRRCSDGVTRVKLPPAATHEYLVSYAKNHGLASDSDDASSPILDLQKQAAALASELAERSLQHRETVSSSMTALSTVPRADRAQGRSAAA